MNKISKIVFVFFAALSQLKTNAQAVNPEPQDLMHSNGKIYVVVAVVVTILLGLFLYVFNLDRKISKMEKGNS